MELSFISRKPAASHIHKSVIGLLLKYFCINKTLKKNAMKSTITIASLMMIAALSFAQVNSNGSKTVYGVKVNNFSTNSGFGYQAGFDVFVQSNNRLLEVGIFGDGKSGLISGAEVQYIHMFKSKKLHISSRSKFVPFFNYNCIYRHTDIVAPTMMVNGKAYNYMNGTVTSIEHYVGLGGRLSMSKNTFIEGSMGFGGYLGSIEKTQYRTKVMFDIKGKDSFGFMGKVSVGVKIF